MSDQDCPNMGGCEMYQLFAFAGTLATWKINYCTGEYARCERYKRAAAGRDVPVNLMPNGALLKKKAAGAPE